MKNIAFVTIALILIISACQKAITIKQLPYSSKPSIQCLITPGTTPHLYLSRTVPYFDAKISNRDLFIDSAIAIISNGINNDTLTIDSSFHNFRCEYEYFYNGHYDIQPNTNYNLIVKYAGDVFTASATTAQQIVPIDSLSYVKIFKDVYGEHEGIIFHFTDNPSQRNYYRYEMHRMIDSTTHSAGKAISPCLTDIFKPIVEIGRTVYSDENLSGASLAFTLEPSYTHAQGSEAFLFLQSCDKHMFDFYDQLDRQKLSQYNPFVEPVFLKPTQFSNAIGVFGSYALSDSVQFIYPE